MSAPKLGNIQTPIDLTSVGKSYRGKWGKCWSCASVCVALFSRCTRFPWFSADWKSANLPGRLSPAVNPRYIVPVVEDECILNYCTEGVFPPVEWLLYYPKGDTTCKFSMIYNKQFNIFFDLGNRDKKFFC